MGDRPISPKMMTGKILSPGTRKPYSKRVNRSLLELADDISVHKFTEEFEQLKVELKAKDTELEILRNGGTDTYFLLQRRVAELEAHPRLSNQSLEKAVELLCKTFGDSHVFMALVAGELSTEEARRLTKYNSPK